MNDRVEPESASKVLAATGNYFGEKLRIRPITMKTIYTVAKELYISLQNYLLRLCSIFRKYV